MKKLLSLFLAALLLCGCTAAVPETRPTVGDSDGLTVHFIDVGQADAALLECGGEFMLIDGGNVDDGQMLVSYLDQMGVETLEAVVCTHAHEDHVGGLASVLAVFPAQSVYSPTTTYGSRAFDNFMYYVDQQRLEVTFPVPGEEFYLGDAQVTVLGPVKDYAETNDTSIVMKVVYGDTSFLFTGDMEQEAETDMLDYGMDVKADVLKVGHHGSNTSTGYRFLYEVDPMYAVISCGRDNKYGHPHREPMERLRQQGASIFRTDEMGTVVAVSDGRDITFTWNNQSADPENAERVPEEYFIGNRNTGTLHSPSCGKLPSPENQVIFHSWEEAMEAGYHPHRSCLGQ